MNPLRDVVTIKEKRALILAKKYPLSGERLRVGSFLYRKVVGIYKLLEGIYFKYLKEKKGP